MTATILRDAKGTTSVDIMPHSQTINSDLYVQTLKTLKKHFRMVQPHKMFLKFSFNMTTYDHTSLKIQEAITNLKWTVLPHTPYSPDLASWDFHLFGALNGANCGQRLGSADQVTEEVKKWRVQNLNWDKKRIDALVTWWHEALKVMEIM